MAASRNKLPTDLLRVVTDFIGRYPFEDTALAVGLSGGCDSVVLLHLLSQTPLAGRLHAIHVHHGLSANADDWADFCLTYCAGLAVPCSVRRVEIDKYSGQGIEAEARRARQQTFLEAGFRTVFLAHHAGDQAETLLFNLFRGSGVSGLAAMRGERVLGGLHFFRPLLTVARKEIEAYAKAHGLNWVVDESNVDRRYSRNFIRHEVLTAARQKFPVVESALLQTAAHCAEAEELLGQLAEMDWQSVAEGTAANMRRLRVLPFPRLKNLLRCQLRIRGWCAPESRRLDEFARQLRESAADRHPQLDLQEGCMQVIAGCLHWIERK